MFGKHMMVYQKLKQSTCKNPTNPLDVETETLVGRMQTYSCLGMITLSALPTGKVPWSKLTGSKVK